MLSSWSYDVTLWLRDQTGIELVVWKVGFVHEGGLITKVKMTKGPESHLVKLYPELGAGGFSRVDGTVAFYSRINALLMELDREPVVVDFGAGRGNYVEDTVTFRRELRRLTRIAYVIGVDIDPVVLANQTVDESLIFRPGEALPLAAESVDLIVADFTFEHVTVPGLVVSECSRILRSGGWICARTPNRRGLIAAGARIVPNRLHASALRHLQPNKHLEDTFPTAYQLNTPRQVRAWFQPEGFEVITYTSESEPRYVGGSTTAAHVVQWIAALTPPQLQSMLYIFMRKGVTTNASGPHSNCLKP